MFTFSHEENLLHTLLPKVGETLAASSDYSFYIYGVIFCALSCKNSFEIRKLRLSEKKDILSQWRHLLIKSALSDIKVIPDDIKQRTGNVRKLLSILHKRSGGTKRDQGDCPLEISLPSSFPLKNWGYTAIKSRMIRAIWATDKFNPPLYTLATPLRAHDLTLPRGIWKWLQLESRRPLHIGLMNSVAHIGSLVRAIPYREWMLNVLHFSVCGDNHVNCDTKGRKINEMCLNDTFNYSVQVVKTLVQLQTITKQYIR